MNANMRVAIGALLILAISAACLWSQRISDDPFVPVQSNEKTVPRLESKNQVVKLPASHRIPARQLTEAEQQIEHALTKKVQLDFIENSLQEVTVTLQNMCEIPIHIDRRALEDIGIDLDTPVTCNLKDVSLRSALELMFHELDLTYTIHNEVLLVTTEDVNQQKYLLTQVYDVIDLVMYRDEKGEPYSDYDPIIEMLTTSIKPESWQDVGGAGTIEGHDFNTAKVLVVTNTYKIQCRIVELLNAIRLVAGNSPGDGRLPLQPKVEAPREMRGGFGYGGMGGMGMGGMGGFGGGGGDSAGSMGGGMMGGGGMF